MIQKIYTENKDEWLALRKGYIGGSEAAGVVGLSPFTTPYQIWAEKTGKVEPFAGNLATEVGTYLEDFVAKLYERETGRKVQRVNASLVNDQYPWAIADIDRRIVGAEEGLEIKTTNSLALKHFAGGDFPATYYCQCMHYLAVTGWQRWHLAVLIGNNDFRTFTIERNELEIDALMEAERQLMEKIERDEPPAAQDGDGATLEAVFPAEREGETVDGTPILDEVLHYATITAQIRDLEKVRNDAASRIKAHMGEAARADVVGYNVSWLRQERKTFDAAKFEAAHRGEDLSGYYKVTEQRVLRISEKKSNK